MYIFVVLTCLLPKNCYMKSCLLTVASDVYLCCYLLMHVGVGRLDNGKPNT